MMCLIFSGVDERSRMDIFWLSFPVTMSAQTFEFHHADDRTLF